MSDPTEEIRSTLTEVINSQEADRKTLEAKYGQVWDTDEVQRDFQVIAFLAPFVGVIRKSDNKKGSLMFQHHPRYYFKFEED